MFWIIGWISFFAFIIWFIWHYFIWPKEQELDGDISDEGMQEPENESRFKADRTFYDWRKK